MKKRISSLLIAGVITCSLFSTTALAASPSPSNDAEKVYTSTIDISPSAYMQTSEETVTARQNMGVALNPGDNGWSNTINVRFSYLPSNAKVQKIVVNPGRAVINNNHHNMTGLVVPSTLKVTSPDGQTADLMWNKTMTDSSSFLGGSAKGTWTMCFYGKNITRPTGDRMRDLLATGSISYQSVKMTVFYTL